MPSSQNQVGSKAMASTDKNFDRLSKAAYESQFLLHGPMPEGVHWVGSDRQKLRFQLLLKTVFEHNKSKETSIADVGCGYGALAEYIKQNASNKRLQYFGYDISEQLINYCHDNTNYSWADFKVGKFPDTKVDYCVMSGTYNLAMTNSVQKWEDYVFSCLNDCWKQTQKLMIFNLQIATVAYISRGEIFYANKRKTLQKCNLLFGPTEIIHHPSLSKDAMFIVKRA